MCSQVVLCVLLVVIQSIIDDELEVRGCGIVSVRHEGRSQQFVRRMDCDGWFCRAMGQRGTIGRRSYSRRCRGVYDIPMITYACRPDHVVLTRQQLRCMHASCVVHVVHQAALKFLISSFSDFVNINTRVICVEQDVVHAALLRIVLPSSAGQSLGTEGGKHENGVSWYVFWHNPKYKR